MAEWQKILRDRSLRSLEELVERFGPEHFPDLHRLTQAIDSFEFRISPAMVDLIQEPGDPIWKQNVTDELEREFDKSDRWIENKSQVRKILNIASDINRTVKNRRLGKKTESNWTRLRFELNTLAKIFKLPKVGSSAYK